METQTSQPNKARSLITELDARKAHKQRPNLPAADERIIIGH